MTYDAIEDLFLKTHGQYILLLNKKITSNTFISDLKIIIEQNLPDIIIVKPYSYIVSRKIYENGCSNIFVWDNGEQQW